jgi:hypothetical protein
MNGPMPFVALTSHVVPLNIGLQPLDGIAFMADVQESAKVSLAPISITFRKPRSTDVGS